MVWRPVNRGSALFQREKLLTKLIKSVNYCILSLQYTFLPEDQKIFIAQSHQSNPGVDCRFDSFSIHRLHGFPYLLKIHM